MGRRRRFYEPGACFHVFVRGHNRCDVFFDAEDHERFLSEVRQASAHYGTAVHAFALMKTHYHLMASPSSDTALPRTVQQFSGDYVRYFNRKYERTGTLWNSRYNAVLIRDERQWLTCLRYIERNPVAAQIVSTPGDYRWSSYSVNALGRPSRWLTPHRVYLALGPTSEIRQAVYRALCDPL